jgi:hypothetical protein
LFSDPANWCAETARGFSGLPNGFSDLFPPLSGPANAFPDSAHAFSFQIPACPDPDL